MKYFKYTILMGILVLSPILLRGTFTSKVFAQAAPDCTEAEGGEVPEGCPTTPTPAAPAAPTPAAPTNSPDCTEAEGGEAIEGCPTTPAAAAPTADASTNSSDGCTSGEDSSGCDSAALGDTSTSNATSDVTNADDPDAEGASDSGSGSSGVVGGGANIAGSIGGCLASSAINALTSIARKITSVPISDLSIETSSGGSYVKQCYLDAIAKGIAKGLLDTLTNETVNWINSGFNGGPAYVTNPGQYFANIANAQYTGYISGSSLGFLNTDPNSTQEQNNQLAMEQSFLAQQNSNQPQASTINQSVTNYDQFVGATAPADFSQGGWSGWLALTQPQNNPYGQYAAAQNQLNQNVSSAVGTSQQVLNWGNGYQSQTDANGNIITPGALVAQTASKVFGNTFDQLDLAKNFDDIINALVNTAMGQLIGAANKGLSGVN